MKTKRDVLSGVDNEIDGAADKEALEAVLRRHAAIEDCVVLARDTTALERRWVAYFVPVQPVSIEKLRDYVAQAMPACKTPVCYVAISSLPLTSAGLVDVDALAAMEVIDDELMRRWESALAASPAVDRAAVIMAPRRAEPQRLHLDDLLVDAPRTPQSAASIPSAAADGEGEHRGDVAHKMAISDGGPLVIDTDAPRTLTQALLRTAASRPQEGIIYVQPDGIADFQDYATLLVEAQSLLAGLRERGLGAGDRVILQIDSLRLHFTAFWACVLGGIVPVTIAISPGYDKDNSVTKKLLNTWLFLKRPRIIASRHLESALAPVLAEVGAGVPRILAVEELPLAGVTVVPHACAPDDVVFLQLTSGSTGTPKCIQETHAGIVRHIHGSARFNGYAPDEVSLNWLPVDHVVPILTYHLKDVYLGCRQVQVNTESILAEPLRWLDLLEAHKATHTWSPNFGFKLVAERLSQDDKRRDLSGVKFFMNAGEQVTLPVVESFLRAVAPFGVPARAMQPAFGMAEACTCMTYNNAFDLERGVNWFTKGSLGGSLVKARPNDADAVAFIDLGPPIPGVQVRITDATNVAVPEGVIGRMQIKGGVITPGYLDNEAANREAFVGDGWFNSGDLGFLLDGRLTLTGREKEMINVRGANVYCYEVEDVINQHAGVQPTYAAAVGVFDPADGTEALAVFFVPCADAEADPYALIKTIRAAIAARTGISPLYVVPLRKADFPKTTSGKIQRVQLRKALEAGDYREVLREADLRAKSERTLPDWFYRPLWRPKAPRGDIAERGAGAALIFTDAAGLGEAVRVTLAAQGRRCIMVERGAGFARHDHAHYGIDPRAAEQYRELWALLSADGVAVRDIVHLWTCAPFPHDPATEVVRNAEQAAGAESLLFLTQALEARDDATRPQSLLVVSRHAQAAAEGDLVLPERAVVTALLKTIAQEVPALDCIHVDLPIDDFARAADFVCRELGAQGDEEVAYRDGVRLVARLQKLSAAELAQSALPFKEGGAYVLSGGLGGVGLEVARFLLGRHRPHLLLLGRAPLASSTERARAYQELQRFGSKVIYASVDIADADAVQHAAAAAESVFGRGIDGVIHMAGVYREQRLRDESAERFAATLHPKVAGAWALHRLVQDRPGSLFINFSSVIGHFGGALVGAYAAANRFLDGFSAYQRRVCGLRSYSLAWSTWDETGLSRGYHGRDALIARGYQPISPKQALQSLLVALRADVPHVLIGLDGDKPFIERQTEAAARPLHELAAFYTLRAGADDVPKGSNIDVRDVFGASSRCVPQRVAAMPLSRAGDIDRAALAVRAKSPTAPAAVAPVDDAQRAILSIWKDVLNVDAIGVNDNFFELGGNSLLIAQLETRIRAALGVELSTVHLFKYPTISALSAYLRNGTDGAAPLAKSRDRGAARRALTNRQRERRSGAGPGGGLE